MKFLIIPPLSTSSRFIYQEVPDVSSTVLPSAEPETQTEAERLEAALRRYAALPEDGISAGNLDQAIQAAVSSLAERLGVNAAPALEHYFETSQTAENSLLVEQIGGLVDEVTDMVEGAAELAELATLSPEETERMQTMSNMEFLEIPIAERLRFITTERVTASDVASGSVDSLTFTFTFDGEYNEALWRDTTAGQVLPPEVRSVGAEGQTFTRGETSLGGEFFAENGQRLKIHEGTALSAIQTGDLAEIQANVDAQLEAFSTVEEGEDARTDGEMLVARMALEHGVQPEFVIAAFVEQNHKIETQAVPEDTPEAGAEVGAQAAESLQLTSGYQAQLEDFLTEIDRSKGHFASNFSGETLTDGDQFTPNFARFFLSEGRTDAEVSTIMTDSGYSAEAIESATAFTRTARQTSATGEMPNFDVEYHGEIPAEHMRTAANLVAQFEGFSATPYWDVDAYRVGYSTDTIIGSDGQRTRVTPGMRVTQEQAVASLAPNIEEHVGVLLNQMQQRGLRVEDITPNQFAVLASIAYNFGPYKFNQQSGQSVLDAMAAGNMERAADIIANMSNSQSGQYRQALMARRGREAQFFMA